MRIHLRAAGDMGRQLSCRTFCIMPLREYRTRKIRNYAITENPRLVTCEKCLARLRRLKGRAV